MGGYSRSSHMKSDLGGHKGAGGGKGQKGHPGFLKTGEKSANVKGPRPDEAGKYGFSGHGFEAEIKETFGKKGGLANIKGKAMPGDSPVSSDGSSKWRFAPGKGKAEHHPRAGEAHSFKPSAAANACGFGHPVSNRRGPLRVSGHAGAHRVGKR